MAGTIGVIQIHVILRRQAIAIRLVENAPPGYGIRAGALKMSAAGIEAAGVVVLDQICAHAGESIVAGRQKVATRIVHEGGSAGDLKLRAVVAGTLNGRQEGVELREIPNARARQRIASWDQLYAGVLRLKRVQSRQRLRGLRKELMRCN